MKSIRHSYYSKIRNYVKLMISLNEMEELKKFQSSTFDTIATRRLVEYQDAILDLTGKIQELQTEINCMNDSRDFRMLNQYAVDNPTLTVTSVLPTSSRSWWNAEPQRRAAKHLGHTWFFGKGFLQIQQRLLQHLIRRN